MTRANPLRLVPPDPGTVVLARVAERAFLSRRVAALDAEIAAACRLYSDAHGFCVTLTAEQVARDIAAREQ